jgi:hypothetical protein
MQYLILIYGDPTVAATMTEAEGREVVRDYFAYTQRLQDAGAFLGGNPLEDTDAATTVRVRDGQRLLTDGPFAETREVLGGYYLIECDTLDEALDHAAACPGSKRGSIEVRPIMPMPARV